MTQAYQCFLILVVLQIGIWAGRDFYKILKVRKGASESEIRSAYKKMVKDHHPDARKDRDTTADFAEISEAYEVLKDANKRKIYDELGEEGLKQNEQGGGFNGASSFFGGAFSSFFGFGGGEKQRPEKNRGADLDMDITLSLNEAYTGVDFELLRNKAVKKQMPGKRNCNCHSQMKLTQMGPGQFRMMEQQVCDSCPNVKFVAEESILRVSVDAGIPDKKVYKFHDEGEPHIDGDNGDLKVHTRINKHNTFRRDGDHLHTEMKVPLLDSMIGFNRKIVHLDNHEVRIEQKYITEAGKVIRIPGEGMPIPDTWPKKFGDLFVKINIDFPNREFNEEEKQILRTLFPSISYKH